MGSIILPPIFEDVKDYEEMEIAISHFFRDEIYRPLLEELDLDEKIIRNAQDSDLSILIRAIESGRLKFYRGHFRGNFSSKLSRALRSLGAKRDMRQGSFRIPLSSLPLTVQQAIAVSESRFKRMVDSVTERLKNVSPAELAERLDLTPYFDRALYRVSRSVSDSLEGITIEPKLTREQRAQIARDYARTLQLPIQDFLRKETEELRSRIIDHAFKGGRADEIAREIERSYGVSRRKARFLARQETSLLMAKYKQVRYEAAGSDQYIWGCVRGSAEHPVRHYHRLNEGKKFFWREGAVVNAKGEKKNPGQDYNCRCFARPIVRF